MDAFAFDFFDEFGDIDAIKDKGVFGVFFENVTDSAYAGVRLDREDFFDTIQVILLGLFFVGGHNFYSVISGVPKSPMMSL